MIGVAEVAIEIRGIRRKLHPGGRSARQWVQHAMLRRSRESARGSVPELAESVEATKQPSNEDSPAAADASHGLVFHDAIPGVPNPWHWRNEAEQMVAHLRAELQAEDQAIRARLSGEADVLLGHIAAADERLQGRIAAVDRLLRDLSEGDLRLRLYGVVAILIGIGLTTWPDRVAEGAIWIGHRL